jgi:hypothetical protein
MATPEAARSAAALLGPIRDSGLPRTADAQRAAWELARHESVHLLFAARMQAAGIPWAEPGLASAARAARAGAAIRGDYERREILRLGAAFEDAGLRLLLLKGAAYAYAIYSRPELRPRTDIDLFVAPGDRTAAEALLRDLAYEPAIEHIMELASAQSHYSYADAAGVRYHVDLHWRVTNLLAFADVLPFAEVWPRAAVLPGLGDVRTLDPADTLLHAALHRIAHHGHESGALWLMDIHLTATQMPPEGWDLLIERGDAARLAPMVRAAIDRCAASFGTVVPAHVHAWLREPRHDAIDHLFMGSGVAAIDALRSDWRSAGSWRRRIRLLYGHVCPPAAYIRDRYTVRQPLLLPLFYARRVLTGLPRWLVRSS